VAKDNAPSGAGTPVLVVEDDVWLRVMQVVLDPSTSQERSAAFADFMAHDVPDFPGWCENVRRSAGSLYPCEVRLVSSQRELYENLAPAAGIVTESLRVGAQELASAPRLMAVHQFGTIFRNIDVPACEARGVKVFGLRRRANIACAEHAFALMLALARRLEELSGRIAVEELTAVAQPYRPFDRRHTPNGNWGRIPGLRSLHGSTVGIIGLGEIGGEIARRTAAFDMRTIYFQRTRLSAAEEDRLQVSYQSLESLLANSDWIIPQLPLDASTVHLLDRKRLALIKPGACIVNVSRAEVIDREALLEALQSGRLGGFALDPLYEAPGRADDELLSFDNVILTPHLAGSPRWNGLTDIQDIVEALARLIVG
jgi:phosphoglycerate dehydrogenase-like enzyme